MAIKTILTISWIWGNAAVGKIKSQELLNQLEQINNLPDEDQKTVVSFLDAFIKRRKFEELAHS
ncbi:MAG: hypothetical protein V2B19_19425 [Pseudomonadota bacterium]